MKDASVEALPRRVIIDTDGGIDDSLALLLALQSPELEIVAVTTVSGNVAVHKATRNVFTVFSLLPSVPKPLVAEGASKPLQKAPFFAEHVHGEDGLGGIHRLREASGRLRYAPLPIILSIRDAVHEILYQLSMSLKPMTVICLGPLTNIASAIEEDRAAMAKLSRIVLMGGAMGVPGNVTPAAEYNIYCDPHAADIVFHSAIALTVVGLDVTRRVRLTQEMMRRALASRRDAVARFVCDCTERLFAFVHEQEGEAGFPLHDPLTVAASIDPTFISTEAMHVEIETSGKWTEGMTVADRRPFKPVWKKPSNADVSVGVDASRFLSFFLERVLCPKSSS